MLELLLSVALALPAAAQEQRTDTTFAAAGATELRVENMNGSVTVRGWSRNQVRVRATHGGRDYIEIRHSSDVIDIEAESRRGAPGNVHFEIDVPAALAVEIEGVYNHTTVHGMAGDVVVETVDGNIEVRGGRGRIELESVQGSVTVDGAEGEIAVSSVNNGVRITDSSGPIEAETVNGPIALTRITSRRVQATTVNGSVTYQGSITNGGRYHLGAHNGDVQLSVPSSTSADITVSTYNGEFEVEFPVQVRAGEARGRFQFQLGRGGARIELESFGGNVRVLRTRNN